jgi:hypothetical protein
LGFFRNYCAGGTLKETGVRALKVSYASFFEQSTSKPIRRKFDEVIFKEDEACMGEKF